MVIQIKEYIIWGETGCAAWTWEIECIGASVWRWKKVSTAWYTYDLRWNRKPQHRLFICTTSKLQNVIKGLGSFSSNPSPSSNFSYISVKCGIHFFLVPLQIRTLLCKLWIGCLENDDLENEDLRPRKRRPTRKQRPRKRRPRKRRQRRGSSKD